MLNDIFTDDSDFQGSSSLLLFTQRLITFTRSHLSHRFHFYVRNEFPTSTLRWRIRDKRPAVSFLSTSFTERALCWRIILDVIPYETTAIKILSITSFSSGKNYWGGRLKEPFVLMYIHSLQTRWKIARLMQPRFSLSLGLRADRVTYSDLSRWDFT